MRLNNNYFKVIIVMLALLLAAIIVIALVIWLGHGKRDSDVPEEEQHKHVLFILADDLGWSDISFGEANAITPNIHKLAMEGIILNNSYSYSMCTPGMFAEHTGMQHFVLSNIDPSDAGLPLNFNLMPHYFKTYGYKTHLVGKWHLGSCNLSFTPTARGFDTFYGYYYGEQNYYTHRTKSANGSGLDFWFETPEKLEPILDKNQTYSTFAFVDRLTNIIESHDNNEPLFLFYSAQNPHSDDDFSVPIEYENRYKNIEPAKRRKILGMTTLLDDSILNITKALEKKGMLDNTIIVFSSDNGGEIYDYQRNFPLRGGKTTVFEGGHRVRAFINARHLKNSHVYDGMFHTVDWLPTLLSGAVGSNEDFGNIDGVNQWNVITENQQSNRDSFIYKIDQFGSRHKGKLYCNLPTESIREGDWKIIRGCPGQLTDWYNLTNFDHNPSPLDTGIELALKNDSSTNCLDQSKPSNSTFFYFLFNIKDDPLEKKNLASERSCKLYELEQVLNRYKKSTLTPLVKEPLKDYVNPKAFPYNWNDKWSPGWC